MTLRRRLFIGHNGLIGLEALTSPGCCQMCTENASQFKFSLEFQFNGICRKMTCTQFSVIISILLLMLIR